LRLEELSLILLKGVIVKMSKKLTIGDIVKRGLGELEGGRAAIVIKAFTPGDAEFIKNSFKKYRVVEEAPVFEQDKVAIYPISVYNKFVGGGK